MRRGPGRKAYFNLTSALSEPRELFSTVRQSYLATSQEVNAEKQTNEAATLILVGKHEMQLPVMTWWFSDPNSM